MTVTLTVSTFQLPEAVQRGAQTVIDDPVDPSPGWSGIEQRVRRNTRRARNFQIGYGIKSKADRQTIYDGYMALGQLICFLFKDWMDYQITGQNIGTGDGANRSFPLKKTYSDGAGNSHDRRITRPIEASIAVTVAGVPSTAWSLDPLGIILFDVGSAPAGGAAVVVPSAEFNCVVRYVGKLAFRLDTALKVSVPTATLKEEFEV
jgi:uncharacterized protein (TIGR02217 family)